MLINNLSLFSYILRGGGLACMEGIRCAYKIVVRKPHGKRLLKKPRRRWEDNIEMVLNGTGWDGVDWIHGSAQ
jgi:hypothetical protein